MSDRLPDNWKPPEGRTTLRPLFRGKENKITKFDIWLVLIWSQMNFYIFAVGIWLLS